MSTILVAVSERWVADERVDAIAAFARRLDATLLLVHIIYQTDTTPRGEAPGEKVLERVAAKLRASQVNIQTLLLFADDVAAAMLKTADEHKASMILLGIASKGMLATFIEGNIAQSVIRNTRLPILLLPADWNGEL